MVRLLLVCCCRLVLSRAHLTQTLRNEPRYWATAGALAEPLDAIAATAEHVQALSACGRLGGHSRGQVHTDKMAACQASYSSSSITSAPAKR